MSDTTVERIMRSCGDRKNVWLTGVGVPKSVIIPLRAASVEGIKRIV